VHDRFNNENDFQFQAIGDGTMDADIVGAEARAASLLRDAAALGRVRVVLRSCSGFMELFCDAGEFELVDGWLTVRRPEAHLHVQVPALHGACLLDAGGDAYRTPHRCGWSVAAAILA
jgi:hypothetical protein